MKSGADGIFKATALVAPPGVYMTSTNFEFGSQCHEALQRTKTALGGTKNKMQRCSAESSVASVEPSSPSVLTGDTCLKRSGFL